MPLPFAPPPKDSSLYQQLESTTLQTLTADQLDTIRAKTFSQGTEGNEDEYRRLLLLGAASNALSLSGPLPDDGEMVIADQTDSSTPIVIRPPIGEVWNVQAIAATNLATLSSSQNYYIFMSKDDDGSVPQTSTDLFLSSLTSSATAVTAEAFFDDNAFMPLTITNSVFIRLYGDFTGTSAGHTLRWFYAYARMR